MSQQKKKKRLRSVILIGAVSAIACGGKAEGDGRQSGDGDGDGGHTSGPVGLEASGGVLLGTGGGWVGAIPTGGSAGFPIGTGGFVLGTGGAFAPGDPPDLGGMGGSSEDEEEIVGLPIR